MRASFVMFVALILAVLFIPTSARADYLKNADLKEGLAGWRGDGEIAFLNPDGTEGAEGDKDVVQVIKIVLSKSLVRSVYQDYSTHDNPSTQHLRVDVFASSEFKRSPFATDYTSTINWKPSGIWYWTGVVTPNVDFWIRGAPGYLYKLANLKPGEWVTVDGFWDTPPPAQDRTIAFMVPPGTGTIYLKNPAASQ